MLEADPYIRSPVVRVDRPVPPLVTLTAEDRANGETEPLLLIVRASSTSASLMQPSQPPLPLTEDRVLELVIVREDIEISVPAVKLRSPDLPCRVLTRLDGRVKETVADPEAVEVTLIEPVPAIEVNTLLPFSDKIPLTATSPLISVLVLNCKKAAEVAAGKTFKLARSTGGLVARLTAVGARVF